MDKIPMRRVCAGLLLSWLLCSVSAPRLSAQVDSLQRTHVASTSKDVPGWRSPFLAFAMSAVATGVPLVIGFSNVETDQGPTSSILILGGLTLGPAAGYIYGGAWGRGLMWAAVRAAVLGGTFVIMLSATSSGDIGAIAVIGVIGLAVVAVDVLYDVFAVGPYISQQNAQRQVFSMSVSPTYSLSTRSVGVRVSIAL